MTHEVTTHLDLARSLRLWAQSESSGVRTSGSAAGFSNIQLHSRPDPHRPEVQLTLSAELVDGMPVIRVSHYGGDSPREVAPVAAGQTAKMYGTNLPPQEPDAVCEACGATGTVGRAVRTDGRVGFLEVHRFCFECWPEQSARYRARWEEEDRRRASRFMRNPQNASDVHPGMAFETATWHTTLELVMEIERMMIAPTPPSPKALADLAAQIQASASQFVGEMPIEVEFFVQRYGKQSTGPRPRHDQTSA